MHRPHLLSVLALAAAACSAPAAPRPVVPPPRVEAAPAPADAAVVANAADAGPALPDAVPAPPPPPPPPPRRPGAFDWQETRDKYAQLFKLPVDTFRCDYRSKYPTLDPVWGVLADCAEFPPPNRLAAKVLGVDPIGTRSCRIVFDIGDNAKISDTWSAALLDSDDVPMTAWAHPVVMDYGRSLIDLPCDWAAARARPHVALVRELRWR